MKFGDLVETPSMVRMLEMLEPLNSTKLIKLFIQNLIQPLTDDIDLCTLCTYVNTFKNDRRPYYKIFPGVARAFMKTKLSIPWEYLKSPYKVFLIRLPTGDDIMPELKISENRYVTAILVVGSLREFIELSLPKNHGLSYDDLEHLRTIPSYMFVYPLIETPPFDYTALFSILKLTVSSKVKSGDGTFQELKNLEEAVVLTQGLAVDYRQQFGLSDDVERLCFKIAASTMLLATGGDKLVEPDILAADFRAATNASPQRIVELHEKAKRRGKNGWTIGNPESLFPRRTSDEDEQSDVIAAGTHGELKHSHIRSGHFHVVRYGEGRELSRVQWYRPTVIRPDLPMKATESTGHKSPMDVALKGKT